LCQTLAHIACTVNAYLTHTLLNMMQICLNRRSTMMALSRRSIRVRANYNTLCNRSDNMMRFVTADVCKISIGPRVREVSVKIYNKQGRSLRHRHYSTGIGYARANTETGADVLRQGESVALCFQINALIDLDLRSYASVHTAAFGVLI